MKKVLCFVSALLFLLAMVGCGQASDDRATVLGSWETEIQASILGVSVPDDMSQTVDAIYRIEFCEDGTGKSNIFVDEKYADYAQDTNVSFTYILDGDKLELTNDDGNIQVFTVSFSGDKLILDGRAHMELVRK